MKLVLTGDYANGIARLRQAIQYGQSAGEAFNYTLAGLYYRRGFYRRSQTLQQRGCRGRSEGCDSGMPAWLWPAQGQPDQFGPGQQCRAAQGLADKMKIPLEQTATSSLREVTAASTKPDLTEP